MGEGRSEIEVHSCNSFLGHSVNIHASIVNIAKVLENFNFLANFIMIQEDLDQSPKLVLKLASLRAIGQNGKPSMKVSVVVSFL